MKQRILSFSLILGLATTATHFATAQAIDLFPDVPKLTSDFIRIGSWNLRHINVEGDADDFLPGSTEEEDFGILIKTFAKAIGDLGLDIVAISEHQPRSGEPNRLLQLRDELNSGAPGPWQADESQIEYDDPDNPFGNLQLAVLWNTDKVSIDPNQNRLLTELRRPRDEDGTLENRRMRAPWLIQVQTGSLTFDLVILHLKSGGSFPQQQEVNALEGFIREHQSTTGRNLIIAGDWNIRPDRSQGRDRLNQMMSHSASSRLMKVLTVEFIEPKLAGWVSLDERNLLRHDDAVARLVPFSHFNLRSIDTFLDHIAISQGLFEIFDHPVAVTLADSTTDLRPGIRVALPAIPEEDYHKLTDHLPVVFTLRTTEAGGAVSDTLDGLRIIAAIPNPFGEDRQFEEVHLRNFGSEAISLQGWKIGDATGNSFWVLTASDGVVQPGQLVRVMRNGRNMALNNTGDTIVLIDPTGARVDEKSYGEASSGKVFHFCQ